MCIICAVRSRGFYSEAKFFEVVGRWGKWTNFLPRQRGEVSHAPWFDIYIGPFGFNFELSRHRPWFKPELTPPDICGGISTRGFIWGFFVFAWRTKV